MRWSRSCDPLGFIPTPLEATDKATKPETYCTNSYAAWSPDSKKIAFQHNDKGSSLYVMDADGGNQVAVIANAEMPAEGGRVAWKPK